MRFHLTACAIALTTLLTGCNVNVEQTETGFIIEIVCTPLDGGEVTPDETPDLEPGTDEEVDGEIPAATDG